MKNSIRIAALVLVLAMSVLALASCGDKFGAIKSAFEGEGYTVETVQYSEMNNSFKAIVETVLGKTAAENISKYEIMTCSKLVSFAIVVKFPAEGDIKNALTVEGSSALYDSLKDSGAINGNCMILTLVPGAIEIFKNA